jgi:rhodanese-related sulfurtransferase
MPIGSAGPLPVGLRAGIGFGMNDEQVIAGELSPEQAAELIEAGAELIDVRRPYEFDGGRIAGARNIEMNELSEHADELPRDRPVIFYCRSGNRSSMAAQAFRQAGFDAHHLSGGLEAWSAEGRSLDPEDGEVRPPLPGS